MGLSCTAGRYFFILSDKNNIERELSHNALQKTLLTEEMNKISQDYQTALSTKTLKWSNNNGVTYQDLSYSTLMSPSAMNNQKPYLITDSSDRVVIASNYKKYAEMISPNGAPGGDYESNRTEILSELVKGVSKDSFNSGIAADADIENCKKVIEDLEKKKVDEIDPLEKKITKTNTDELLEKLGNATNGKSWKSMYSGKEKVSISDGNGLKALAEQLKKLAKYFPDVKEEDFKTAIDNSIKGSLSSIENGGDIPEGGTVSGKKGDYKVDVLLLVNYALGSAVSDKKVSNSKGYNTEKLNFEWKDVDDTTNYNNWKTLSDKWQKDYEAAQKNYDTAVAAKSGVFTSQQEREIAFYDAMFTAIAEKGWTYNENVSDNDYLNEMLQNGNYYLTTMEKSLYADGQNNDGTANFKYEYSTGIAENDNHVYKVNDSSKKDVALAIYEDKKRTINAKETKIDNRNNDLQTRLSADQQMLQNYKQIMSDNIERTMSWCS